MPYQIIHTFEGFLSTPQIDGMTVLLGRNEEPHSIENVEMVLEERLAELIKKGIDGLVVNIGGIGYLESEEGWELLNTGLEKAVDMGFKLWIYDEKGYPSGSAGGLVLRDNPEYEALGIKKVFITKKNNELSYEFREKGAIRILRCEVYSSVERDEKVYLECIDKAELLKWGSSRYVNINNPKAAAIEIYYIATLYEGSHASRSYAEKRRYINLLDSRAVKKFTEVTHDKYKQKLSKKVMERVDAFFTDEPSFMSVALSEIGNEYEFNIPVLDETDPLVPILPALPFSNELEEEFTTRSGVRLENVVDRLFMKSTAPDNMKCLYWEAAAITYEKAYAMQLAKKCEDMGIRLTGHIISEESPLQNMVFHSNPFRVLKHFTLPGVDVLTSEIKTLKDIEIFTHKMPFSCAYLQGKKGIMTETSDFIQQRYGEKRGATKEAMLKTLCLQYLLGVREYSYYYDFREKNIEDYNWVNKILKNICEYDNSLVYKADAAIYIPYESIWAWFVPTETEFKNIEKTQCEEVLKTQRSVLGLCEYLFSKNIQFVLVDESSIADLIYRDVKNVIMPFTSVVSYEILKAAKDGKICIYGSIPEFTYKDGEIAKSPMGIIRKEVSGISPLNELFEADKNIYYSNYVGGECFALNQLDSEAYLTFIDNVSIYDPFEDKRIRKNKGEVFELDQGKVIFIKKTSFMNTYNLSNGNMKDITGTFPANSHTETI